MNDLLRQTLSSLIGRDPRQVISPNGSLDLGRGGLPLVMSIRGSPDLRRSFGGTAYKRLHCFAVMPTYSRPRWLLPLGDPGGTLAGTEIYMPHRWAARFAKGLLVKSIRRGWGGWARSKVLIASKEPLPLEGLVHAVTGECHPTFALSLGRQPAVRKLTVQVMRPGGEILGYVKLPLTDAAHARVQHEAKVLQCLWEFPNLRPHIPRVLYAGTWSGTYLVWMSPLLGELGSVTFNTAHNKFLNTLHDVHSVEKPGETLINAVAAKWKTAAPLLGNEWEELSGEVLRRSSRMLSGEMLRFAAMHGDFAPWNTRTHHGELLLFDWESAALEAPTAWDELHFHLQTAYFLNKSNRDTLLCSGQPAEKASLMLYLLRSVCQFLEEGNHSAIEHRQELLRKQLQCM